MAEKTGIPVGSGFIYEMEFTGTIPPDDTTIETDTNRLGYIEKGGTLTYKPTFKAFTDDMGMITRNKLTAEEVTFKCSLIAWVYSKLKAMSATTRITEGNGKRTLKIGGINNDDGKSHLIRFVHPDNQLGDVRVTVIGVNTGGFTLAYTPDASGNLDVEITAQPNDNEGTLVVVDITDPGTETLGTLMVTSAAGTTSGKTALTVVPSLTSGSGYKYKTAATVTLPALNDSTATGYTAWDGSAEITATTGNQILVVEVDSSGLVKKAGTATVTSKA